MYGTLGRVQFIYARTLINYMFNRFVSGYLFLFQDMCACQLWALTAVQKQQCWPLRTAIFASKRNLYNFMKLLLLETQIIISIWPCRTLLLTSTFSMKGYYYHDKPQSNHVLLFHFGKCTSSNMVSTVCILLSSTIRIFIGIQRNQPNIELLVFYE